MWPHIPNRQMSHNHMHGNARVANFAVNYIPFLIFHKTLKIKIFKFKQKLLKCSKIGALKILWLYSNNNNISSGNQLACYFI